MLKNKLLKILVAYNKPGILIKNNEEIIPIHVGREIENNKESKNVSSNDSDFILTNMIGDDTGDNISSKNREYCELTAIYWAWKNYKDIGSPDYIGFMDDKRLLNLSEKNNTLEILDFNDKIANLIGYSKENIDKLLSKYDVILPAVHKTHPEILSDYIISNYAFYAREHIIDDLEKVIEIIKNEYKDYQKDMNDYLYDTKSFSSNIFIMKREIFFKYCEWLFSILFKYEKIRGKRNDIEINQNREIKYISERLLNIFVRNLNRNENINIMYTDIVHVIKKVDDIDLSRVKLGNKDISKIKNYKTNNNTQIINIVYSSDNNYAQHCCCSIASILLNSDENSHFNFIILDGGISKKNKNRILALKNIKNCDISFYDMKSINFSDDFKLNREHISISTYYRLIMFNILDKSMEKVIYIDCDTIVETNIKKLWDIDIENYSALVVDDECGMTQCKRMGLPFKNRYFNAGVIVFNVAKLREKNIYNRSIKIYKENFDIMYFQDQDILNFLLNGDCKYISLNWNTNTRIYLGNNLKGFNVPYSEKLYSEDDEENAKYNPYIIHYTDSIKPWNINCKHPLKNEYFEYLKFTKFSSFIIKYYFNKYIFNYYKDFKYLRIKFLFIHLTINKEKL
ncbi:DUF4422 domain-containing protein [Brachyspira pilosicoli]|uniref:DUF4422 domain-containing protein n=1 Tax=Brachyspira pilosicoli TaxID=52584 RepID=UPI003004B95A